MVHQHHEPAGNVVDRPNGPAAPRLPAEDSHQDCQSETAVLSVSEPQWALAASLSFAIITITLEETMFVPT